MKIFSINDNVKVKLTDSGMKILESRYLKFASDKDSAKKLLEQTIDENGYATFQIWYLIQIFGEYIYPGNLDLPFDINNILIEDQYLLEPKKEEKQLRQL